MVGRLAVGMPDAPGGCDEPAMGPVTPSSLVAGAAAAGAVADVGGDAALCGRVGGQGLQRQSQEALEGGGVVAWRRLGWLGLRPRIPVAGGVHLVEDAPPVTGVAVSVGGGRLGTSPKPAP